MYGLTPFEKRAYGLFDAFHDFEDNFMSPSAVSGCKTDIKDEGDKFVLEAEMPGFEKDDIKLDLDGDKLVISAEHSASSESKGDDGKYIRRERTFGSYSRSFDVSSVDTDKINAEYKNGVLILDLPKKQPAVSSARRLEIK